jgi:hypothetical protein
MFVPLVLALEVALAGTPVPSPSPTASEQPLQVIGHVYSSGACTAIVMHANDAITTALHNDETVTLAVNTLRRVDLDSQNGIAKENGMRAIQRIADALRVSSDVAAKDITKLRELSGESKDAVRKTELKAFADALGGALHRQERIGSDLQTMLLRMYGRDSEEDAYAQIYKMNPQRIPLPEDYMDAYFAPVPYNVVARRFAVDLEHRTVDIAADESRAAEHVVGAVNGC